MAKSGHADIADYVRERGQPEAAAPPAGTMTAARSTRRRAR